MQEDGPINPRCPKIRFSEEEIKEFYKPWSRALVVRILERSFAYPLVKRRLEFLWAKAGRIQVSDLSNEFFLVRFSDADDYQRAAFQGPWKMAVARIGNHIGKTVRLDLATKEGARARYARVCVEVDISKPLLGKYMIGDQTFLVEYECLENICYTCGNYGHKLMSCPTTAEPPVVAVQPEPDKATEATNNVENDAGSWMTVSRRFKGKHNKQKPIAKADSELGKPKAYESGSRFVLLQQGHTAVADRAESREIGSPPQKAPAKNAQADPINGMVALTEKLFVNNRTVSSGQKATPLSDITNLGIKKKTTKNGSAPGKEDSSANLFSVPISFGNPSFEAFVSAQRVESSSQGVKGKGKTTRLAKTAQVVGISKDKAKTKSYVPRGLPKHTDQSSMVSQSTGTHGGRPPDIPK
ncbi:hypothetical protein LINPERPRIM_LOCUS17171 [Linum perenne]